jgi:hypothetical protein
MYKNFMHNMFCNIFYIQIFSLEKLKNYQYETPDDIPQRDWNLCKQN